MTPVIVVEAQPRRPSDATVRTVRLAGGGDQFPYRYGDVDWWGGILRLPSSVAKLDFDGEQMSGGGIPNALELFWQPAEGKRADDLASLWWKDAPITVRVGPEGRAMPPIDTVGKVADVSIDAGVMKITLADVAIDLKRALLVDRFAGTGGLEGPPDLDGQPKSRAWGRCWNVPGRPLILPSNIWCFGDPRHPWLSFDQVRVRGVPASTYGIIEWHGSPEATLAVLTEAKAPEGGCLVAPSIACVKWWTDPAGDLHADIRGEIAGGYVETAPEIASRIVAARSTLAFVPGAVAAAAAARPAPFGYRVADESTTAATAVSEILGDVGLSWVIDGGAIDFRQWDWTAPVRTARSERVSRRELVKLVATKRIGYRRNQAVMARGDLAGIVFAQDVVFDDGSTAAELIERFGRIVSDSWLSQGEKPEVIRAYAGVTATRTANDGLYQAFGAPESVTAARTAASAAVAALQAYLTSLAPAWDDVTTDTPVNGEQFTTLFATAHTTLQGFSAALSEHAARVAEWDLINDPNGTKPDNNATNSGDPESPFGSGKVKEAIATLARVEPIEAKLPAIEAKFDPIESDINALKLADVDADRALVALGNSFANQDAAQRQIDREVGRLEEAVLRALMESSRTRDVLRDAGFVVDPASGQVRIYAIDQLRDRTSSAEIAIDAVKGSIVTKASVSQVQELIAQAVLDPSQVAELGAIIARLTSAESEIDGLNAAVTLKASLVELSALAGRTRNAELSIDALTGAVALKADTATLDQFGLRLGSAEQVLSALPDVSNYSVTIRQARGAADGAAEAALRGMLAGERAHQYQLTQVAEARQELTTKLLDGFSAEAAARTVLSVQIGAVNAAVLAESQARITRDGVFTQRLDAQGAVLDGQAGAISDLQEVAIDAAGGIARAQMTIRQQAGAADQSDEALLRALLAGEQSGQARAAQLVQIQSEFTTTLVANEAASAAFRQTLLVRMNAAEGAIVNTAKVVADANAATAERIAALEVAFNDAASGLFAARARIVALEEATAQRDAAMAGRLDLIEATVEHPTTGLAATRATVAEDREASVTRYNANAQAVSQLSAQVNNPENGLPATAAGLIQERTARADGDTANAQEIGIVSAALNHPETGLPAMRAVVASDRQARIDGDSANAQAVDQLRAEVNNPETGLPKVFARIDQEREASVTRDSANSSALQGVSARIDGVDDSLDAIAADIVQLAKARVDGDTANAELIQQVRARLNDIGGVSIEQKFEALVEATGRILGTATVAIDTNGNMVGTQLIGSASGPGSFNLINADFRMGTGKIIFNNGVIMRVEGTGFGKDGDLITWYGPTMAVSECTRANAINYEADDGDAHFGGSLTSGKFKNDATGSQLASNASVLLGPFRSDGGEISVVFTYSYMRTYRCAPGSGAIVGNGSATIQLRDSNSTGGVITTLAAQETNRGVIVDGDPSVPDRVRWSMSGAVTVKWTAGVTDTAQLFGVITERSLPTLLGEQITESSVQQFITIVAIEK